MIKSALFKQTPVYFTDTGKGRTIVLLHGFPESKEIWSELIKECEKKFRIIAIDLPGFGATPCIGYVHTMELMADAVKAVLKSLHLRKVVLAGHSMGGYVALAFAEKFAEHTKGICLMHSTPKQDTAQKKADRKRAIEIVKHNSVHYISEVIDTLFAPGNEKRFKSEIEKLKAIGKNTSAQGIINALEGMMIRPDRTNVIVNSNFPVFFIIGRKDRILNADDLLKISRGCSRASVCILENAGHLGFVEGKQEVIVRLMRFARRCF